jgi:hypothetical protein
MPPVAEKHFSVRNTMLTGVEMAGSFPVKIRALQEVTASQDYSLPKSREYLLCFR